jgi:hypothetical protein
LTPRTTNDHDDHVAEAVFQRKIRPWKDVGTSNSPSSRILHVNGTELSIGCGMPSAPESGNASRAACHMASMGRSGTPSPTTLQSLPAAVATLTESLVPTWQDLQLLDPGKRTIRYPRISGPGALEQQRLSRSCRRLETKLPNGADESFGGQYWPPSRAQLVEVSSQM